MSTKKKLAIKKKTIKGKAPTKVPAKVGAKKSSAKKKSEVSKSSKEENTPKVGAAAAEAYLKKMKADQHFKGKAQICRASEFASPYNLRRPTGVPQLDKDLGGGFHAGGGVQIHAAESAGKTHLAFRTAAQVQRNYGNNAVILVGCTEIRLDKSFARRAGFCVAYSDTEINELNTIRVRNGLRPFTSEEKRDLRKQIGEVIIITGETGDYILDAFIEALRDMGSACQLAILESLGALLTKAQDKKDVGDFTYGGSANLITLFQNKVYPLFMMDRSDGSMLETTILGVNQARANITTNPKAKATKPAAGAYAWRHAQLASVELRKGEPIWKDKSHSRMIGRTVKWEISKGKAGTHDGLKGEYDYYHVGTDQPVFWADVEENGHTWGIDTITDLCGLAKDVGIVQGTGWYTWRDPDDSSRIIFKCQGMDTFADKIVTDEELQALMWSHCLKTSGLTVRFK